ncbi:hypothetical protein [Yimella sp. cx-51]|uniref:hypothetical protein n=1 Tax=Yimella sp. cx-51 TaxID=2770551 RepID=UPI00165D7F9D|nr:hypothetical protein [Yimella sp. cx-51]MBC9958351.1 hypothetical protein [Yimella sp. cx-51]QTH39733.1 hypothetical protein J5M86_15260 [Yimella sp. cx-51]
MMNNKTGSEHEDTRADEPRPWGMRGPGWVLALGTMFLVVVAMIAVFVVGRGGQKNAGPTEVTRTVTAPALSGAGQASSSAPSGSSTAASGQCPTPKQDSAPAETAELKTTWEVTGQVLSPSTEAGPKVKSDGLRRCFDRSPRGAVAFAANTFLGFMQAPDVARQVALHQMTPGAARDQTLQSPGTTDTSTQFGIAGYRVLAWSPDAAQVEFAVTVSTRPGTWTRVAPRIVWSGDDWKMDGANLGPDPAPLDSLAMLTQWGPGGAS